MPWVLASAGTGVVCALLAYPQRQGTHARRGWLPALASSQPGQALGELQAWQGSPGWLRWAALQLPTAFPSLTEVLRAGISNAFLIGFNSPFKVVTALGLDFSPL